MASLTQTAADVALAIRQWWIAARGAEVLVLVGENRVSGERVETELEDLHELDTVAGKLALFCLCSRLVAVRAETAGRLVSELSFSDPEGQNEG